MKQLNLLCIFLFTISIVANSQNEGSAFTLTGMGVSTPFARDYQALGINVANLDMTSKFEDKSVTLGFAEIGLSLYSEVLTKPELRQNLFREDIKEFNMEQQRDYALAFANSDNAIDLDAMAFGISLRTENLGTFAFSTREKVNFYSRLGNQVSDIVWLGYNASYFDSLIVDYGNGNIDTIPNSEDIDPETLQHVQQGITALQNAKSLTELLQGTKFGFGWYREFSLGWGKRLLSTENLELHGGLAAKLLVGHGMLDVTAENDKATAFSALSPIFGIEYGSISDENPSSLDSNARPLQPVGLGYGFDLGATIVYKQKFIFNLAINDIGKITWDGNLYKLNDTQITNFKNPGLESVDFIGQINQLNGSDGLVSWLGEQKRTTSLPTTVRAGFGFDNNKSIKAGIDFVAPLSDDLGNMQTIAIALGGEYSPTPWLHLQAGYTQGGNYGSKIPIGIYFTVGQGTYEFGAASRDLVTFFRDNEPTISAAIGFLRFRF